MFTFLTCRKLLYAITIYLNSKKKKAQYIWLTDGVIGIFH